MTSLKQLFAQMPREVLAKNFMVPPGAFEGIPAYEKYVFHTGAYRDVSLNNWLALTPLHLVEGHLDVAEPLMSALRPTRQPLVKG